MAASKTERKKLLKYFYDHDDQDAKDLQYGGQKASLKKYLKKPVASKDAPSDAWTPDED